MSYEEPLETGGDISGKAGGYQLIGQVRLVDIGAQFFQGCNHFFVDSQMGCAGVSPELTLPAEPEDDDTGQDTEHHLSHKRSDIKSRAMPPFGLLNNTRSCEQGYSLKHDVSSFRGRLIIRRMAMAHNCIVQLFLVILIPLLYHLLSGSSG